MTTELRVYQQRAVEEVDHHKRPLIVAPTGSGKTVIASEIIRRSENRHVLFLAHRRELIHQARNSAQRSSPTSDPRPTITW